MHVVPKFTLAAATVFAIATVTSTAPIHKSRASIQEDLIGSPCTFAAAHATQGVCLETQETSAPVSTVSVEQADEAEENEDDLDPLFSKPKKCRRLHEPPIGMRTATRGWGVLR
jgi:hypothetical protein